MLSSSRKGRKLLRSPSYKSAFYKWNCQNKYNEGIVKWKITYLRKKYQARVNLKLSSYLNIKPVVLGEWRDWLQISVNQIQIRALFFKSHHDEKHIKNVPLFFKAVQTQEFSMYVFLVFTNNDISLIIFDSKIELYSNQIKVFHWKTADLQAIFHV